MKTKDELQDEYSEKAAFIQSKLHEKDLIIDDQAKKIGELESYQGEIIKAIKSLPPIKKLNDVQFKEAKKGDAIHDAVLFIADTHAEEVVSSEEMEGYAKYDWDVFLSRLWLTMLKTIELTNLMRTTVPVPRLVINFMGDIITGKIREELKRTNFFTMPVAIAKISYAISQFLIHLAPNFEEIQINAVVGNHGRDDDKPQSKQAAERNWDYGIYQITKLFTSHIEKISWNIPISQSIHVNMRGVDAIIKHGGTIKMSNGTMPYYGIAREFAKEREKRRKKESFDFLFLAHFHEFNVLKGNTVLCPSMIGPNQYSFSCLNASYPPEQLLIFTTDKKDLGIVNWEPIKLEAANGHNFIIK